MSTNTRATNPPQEQPTDPDSRSDIDATHVDGAEGATP